MVMAAVLRFDAQFFAIRLRSVPRVEVQNLRSASLAFYHPIGFA